MTRAMIPRGAAPSLDPDTLLYEYQEAHGLRMAGWTVEPPPGVRWEYSRCVGVGGRECLTQTPRLRCYFCNRTLARRAA